MENEVLPPMVKCNECIYAKPFKDVFNGKIRYMCQFMLKIGGFGDNYTLVDTACTEGKKKADGTAIPPLVGVKDKLDKVNIKTFIEQHQ